MPQNKFGDKPLPGPILTYITKPQWVKYCENIPNPIFEYIFLKEFPKRKKSQHFNLLSYSDVDIISSL